VATSPLTKALRRDDAAWAREHIETDVVAWLTTVAPDGRPQSSVISFLHEDGTILFYSEPDTPKMRNIKHSAKVSLNLQSDPYGDHYLVIEGTIAIDPSVPPSDRHAAYHENTSNRTPTGGWRSPTWRAISRSRCESLRRASGSPDRGLPRRYASATGGC
jgi:PPOX class probable F420-dependent enzyme